MTDLKQLEFYILRYVPYVNRVDCISIGVLLLEPLPHGFGFADVRMTSDWRRVRCFNPQVDIDVLQGIETDIRVQLRNSHDPGLLLLRLVDSHSNIIQISARQVCLAADPAKELKRLCALNVDEPQGDALPAIGRTRSEHAMILDGIEGALTRAGIWALRIEKIKAVEYTKRRGDPLVFDFGYVVGTEVRFFQAVPLLTKSNQSIAVNIAYHFPEVADCIHAENGSRALLTAVVADDLDRANPDIEFALDAFKGNKVDVATVAEMPSIADKTRQDLNGWRR
jgi:Protein of unknown function (DUF3037)